MADRDMTRLCRQLIADGDSVKAWYATNALLNESPDSPEALYLMGMILREQGHVGLALPVLGKALSAEQRQPNLWMNYGATLHDLNRWDEAIQAFRVTERMVPNDPMPYANIAGSYANQGKWHDAINMADKALGFGSRGRRFRRGLRSGSSRT